MAFVLDKTSKIALYGAGKRCEECYENFLKNEFNICCIIDKNPNKVVFKYDCPVVEMYEAEELIAKDTVIVVCLQNGLLHDNIASQLFAMGYSNIVFLPTCDNYLHDAEMRLCYQGVLAGAWSEDKEVPQYDEMMIDEWKRQLIKDDGDMVTCWVNMEYIFSYNQMAKKNEMWFNKHISFLTPYIELFDYIQGGTRYPNEYLTCFRGDDIMSQRQLLLDRVKLWNVYEEKINTDSTYFSTAPIYAKWEENHFSIVDGHHRAVYLFLKGWYEVPIRISKKHYEEYLYYKKEQSWECLEKKIKRAMFRLCVQLSKWMNASQVYFEQIVEQEETHEYISHWLDINQKKDRVQNYVEQRGTNLFVSLDTNFISEIIGEAKEGKLITCETENLQQSYKKICDLYEGFIQDKKVRVCIYDIES